MRKPVFNYVLAPRMDVSQTDIEDFYEGGNLGKNFFKSSFMKTLKKPFKLQRKLERKLWKATVPKSVRKVFTRKNFIKFAPFLAIAAEVLNIIPGLGVAVSAGILIGAQAASAALAVATAIAKSKQAKADSVKAEKQANAQANANFAASAEYLTQTYGVTQQEFNAYPLDKKVAFLQKASDDAASGASPAPSQVSGLGYSGRTFLPSLGLTVVSPESELQRLRADQAVKEQQASASADAAFDKSQGYFTEKYNVTAAQFKAMSVDDKLNFLQVAVEDAQAEAKAGQGPWQGAPVSDPVPGKAPAPSSGGGGSGILILGLLALGIMAMANRKK